jgi:hypothetical protein
MRSTACLRSAAHVVRIELERELEHAPLAPQRDDDHVDVSLDADAATATPSPSASNRPS